MRTHIILSSVNATMQQRGKASYHSRKTGTGTGPNPASARTGASEFISQSLNFLFYKVTTSTYPSRKWCEHVHLTQLVTVMRTKESRTQGLSSAGKSHSCPLPKLLSPTCLDRSYIIRFIIGAQTAQANMHVWKHNMMRSKWLSMQMHTKPRT